MLPVRDPANLCTGDVLIHPTRGGAIVDEAGDGWVWVELTERLDRSQARLSAADLSDGWRQAVPGGLFEQSVLRPDEAASRVGDRPGDALRMLADELATAVDRELAATWLVSRGLLAPGRTVTWWTEAFEAIVAEPDCSVDASDRVIPSVGVQQVQGQDPAAIRAALAGLGARRRFELLDRLSPGSRQALLEQSLSEGDTDLAAVLVRWPGTISNRMHARLDRLLSSGHRTLAMRVAQVEPRLVAPALLGDARINGGEGVAGSVLAAMPSRRRAVLLMELLSQAMGDSEAVDAAEGLIDEHGGLQSLQERVEPQGSDVTDAVEAPDDGSWVDALHWLRSRSADTTMEMPSLHPTPLLRESGRLAARDAFSASISLARALARRHAEGRAGGIRGARLHRAEWRVDLGPAEPATPVDDVHDAMRLVLDLLVGRLPPGVSISDDAMLAHLASLAPDVPIDWISIANRAMSARSDLRPGDGLALWLELEHAQATARLREAAPPRTNLDLELGHDTHIGAVKARLGQTNQDALFFHHHGPLTLLLVGDGISISSAGSGNLASALLVQAVASLWEEKADALVNAEDERIFAFLREALAEANTAVCETAWKLADGDLRRHIPMGTTAVMALVRGGVTYLSSVGDSRIYLVGRGGCAQLTSDGNLRGDWLRALQAGQHIGLDHDGAALTSYVGHFDEEDRPAALPPQQRAVTLLPGEHLVLCSDGLTDFATTNPGDMAAMLEDHLSSAKSVGHACRDLVAQANAGGGGDNITVLAARIPG